MARKVTRTLARVGWAAAEDLRALFCLMVGLTLSGAPLLIWQITARHLYRDVFAELPTAVVLASFALAFLLSGGVLVRFYRLTER
jgi:hypothetical protein